MKSRRQATDSRGRSSRLKADWLARRYSTEHREVGHSNVAKEREQKITTLTVYLYIICIPHLSISNRRRRRRRRHHRRRCGGCRTKKHDEHTYNFISNSRIQSTVNGSGSIHSQCNFV